ncbi:catenin delta-2 isoform X3 [Schistocerca americana]|uniref:catenin delta-2 isoform X3 n=1 Tax=Schistocerca americana TaxID=7009 RepID=UPI001F4FDBAC|nr:catenin delta-2 isoform X3 [Schistocerca americana]XP_049783885.1 catenin delta-2 isoform X3 [Schistocerca cancellata]XP_049805663.1 catenin delta-2 isoform X3 [Schistocerca nitens]XP_049953821.1 catenin delta-2 isoform X3 [Schistocerca serialis cubense]
MKVVMTSSNQLIDSCLRVLQEKTPDMLQYTGQPELHQGNSYSLDMTYHPTNGHQDNHSPNSSHLSVQSGDGATLVSRTQKQQTTQQVTTLTKVVREVHHVGPDGQQVDYVGLPYSGAGVVPPTATPSNYPPFTNYELLTGQEGYPPMDPARRYPDAYHPSYQDYEQYPPQPEYPYQNPAYPGGFAPYGDASNYVEQPGYVERPTTPPSPSERSESPPLQQSLQHDYLRKGAPYSQAGYDELDSALMPGRQEHYRITPSPGAPVDRYDHISHPWNIDESGEPSQLTHGEDPKLVYGYPPSPYGTVPAAYGTNGADPRVYEENGAVPRTIFEDEEELRKHLSMHPAIPSPSIDDDQRGMRWRDPNLTEVIGFLNNPNNVIKANAAAYLQHLCYMDDPNKQKTRSLGGIPPLVSLLSHESPDVYRNACGALRNLSYGRQNDENKRAIKNAGGIPSLINLLQKSSDSEVKELVTGVLWNLSSCEDLKRSIIDDGLAVIVNHVIIPHSGWDSTSSGETCWSTIFRNASGVLRNVSSAGEYARKKLRECDGLVDSLLYVVRSAIEKSNIGNKSVENCVCVLRNLSYRCQEVEDPHYDKHPVPTQSRVGAQQKGDNLGCFGASKKKKDAQPIQQKETAASSRSTNQRLEPVKGMELLWQPEVVQSYLSLLQSCSNPETLEAAAGALQNLAACYWQPSIEIRAAVRKEKGLPILVELLRMEVDRVVCAVATALRNLAIDQRNKELIGKYAMRDLVQKLPSGNPQHDQGTSDDTIAAVLATLNEVIKKNAEFSRSLLEAGGVERLMNITRQRQKYTPRVLKFAGQVLFTMWQHQELREVYKKHGWKEQDFVTKTIAARNAGPNSPNNANSTLNRPMASQGGTRYEDRTMQRPTNVNSTSRSPGPPMYQQGDEIPMADMSYPEGGTHAPPPGGVRTYPAAPLAKPGEPLYAQVNREKKKNRQYESGGSQPQYDGPPGPGDMWGYEEPGKGVVMDSHTENPTGGDSWV